jgi:elongation factor G
MARKIENLRNIGIIAHIDAGKTTLTERMLYYCGATHRMGDVDKGTTTTDDDPEEQERGITIYSACVTMSWSDVVINLIDTPGHVDFTAEVERSLRVLDGGVVVFSAREGVEAQSETVWRQADRYGVPRIAFINKMDREGASFYGTLEQIMERLTSAPDSAQPLVLQIPIGAGPPHQEDAFRGVIDLITMKKLVFEAESRGSEIEVSDIPDELRELADQWRSKLLEQIYEYSDELMLLGLEEAPIPAKLIRKVVRQATVHRYVIPVFCGSALDYAGVQPILDAVEAYLPSPLDVPPVEGEDPRKKDKTIRRKPDVKEPFCGLVFKILSSKHGDLSWVRVYSGKLKASTRVFNPGKKEKENAAQLWHIHATKKEEQVPEVEAGDIVGIIGLRHSVTGDTICETQHPILLESITFPETVISMAIEPESSAERKKLAETLEMMKRQDPTFRAIESEDTGQTLISGMGELHLEVIKHKLLRDFNLDVKVHNPRVSYRESVQKAVEVEGECHRQIGGEQLFAKVRLRMAPIEEATIPVTVESAAGEEISPLMLAIVLEELKVIGEGGGIYGNPLMKIKVTVTGGEVREGETTDVAMRIATSNAFDKALREAGMVLLEPIMRLEITTPEEHLGDFIGDLQQRRAIITKTTNRGDMTVIEAEVPLASLFGYSSAMRGLSQGRATCAMEPLKYGPAPPDVADGMI